MDATKPCPCSSGKEYQACCKPFHDGRKPDNALQLMRSRYSAYVLNIPDYIINTTHPGSPQYTENKFGWKRSITQFSKRFVFQKLEVLDFKEKNNLASVTFTAFITQDGQDATFTERSIFEKLKGRWLYRGGQLEQGHVPNLVTTGQLRLLPLAYYGDPILRRKADTITEITDDIRKLVDEMIETMDASDGIGLAAPQVHHSIRLFLIRAPVETDHDTYEYAPVKVLINPVLTAPSKETCEIAEGCLSIPTLRANVVRPKEITVEYMDLDGKKIKTRMSGWEARIAMHENDHIDGILYIDRLSKEEQDQIAPFLQNLENRIHDGRAL